MNKSLIRLFPFVPLIPFLFLAGLSSAQADSLEDNMAKMEGQSPIDINAQDTLYDKNLSPLQFNLSSNAKLDVINNGSPHVDSTIRANVAPGSTVTVNGDVYTLAQFHFHTPSEHLLNGRTSPMELHLVFNDAANHILVVGRWIEYGNTDSALVPIFSDLPKTTSVDVPINSFDLNSLIPDNLESFRYSGSLTTPPFSEAVTWIELAKPLDLSASQIQAFQALFPSGDAREIQPLNGRVVLTDVPGFASAVPEPETYAMLLAGIALIGFIARRRSVNPGLTGLAI